VGRATWEACSSNLETWEPSQHSLVDTGKARKTQGNQERQKETKKDKGKPRKTQGNQERHRETKKDTGKPKSGSLGTSNFYTFLEITNLTHFSCIYLFHVYMFRPSQRSSSGDRIVLIHHLVWLVCVSDCFVCRSGGKSVPSWPAYQAVT